MHYNVNVPSLTHLANKLIQFRRGSGQSHRCETACYLSAVALCTLREVRWSTCALAAGMLNQAADGKPDDR